jgi:carbonic anhydrase/acetyltransferase-like protein (isoleucine patch superfamily)
VRSAADWVGNALRCFVDEPLYRVKLAARLTRPHRRLRFHSFGADSILHRPRWLYGPHQIAVGKGVVILHGAWLAVERAAWDAEGPVLSIGDGVACRPNCTISATESVVIEDYAGLAAGCTVIDSDHTIGPAEHVLYNPVVSAPIRIGRGSWLGERVSVLRGADIGRYCVIGANSVVKGTIPDYSVAVGAPARVVGSTRPSGSSDG